MADSNILGGNNDLQNLLAQQAMALGGYQAIPQIQRSQYLTEALKVIGENAQGNIKNYGALGANLLAEVLAMYGRNKANKELLNTLGTQQSQQIKNLFSQLGMGGGSQNNLPAPPTPPAQNTPPANIATAPPMQPQAQAAPKTLNPADLEAAARAVWGEARGEGPIGEQAVAGVIANRANMTGLPISQIVAQPHQFAGYSPRAQALPSNSPQLQQIEQTIAPVLMGQAPNPAGQADHFYAPRGMPGGVPPSWAQGQQQTPIGNQNFLSLGFGGKPPMQAGAMPPPQAQGGPPAPPPMAQGGAAAPNISPAAPQGLPPGIFRDQDGTYYAHGLAPTPEEMQQVQLGLSQPQGSAAYQAAGQKLYELAQRRNSPVKLDLQKVGDMPVLIGPGGQQIPLGVPDAAKTHFMSPQQITGAGMTRGTVAQESPLGVASIVNKPPEGYQGLAGGGGLQPVPGGPASISGGNQPSFQASQDVIKSYKADLQPLLQQQQAYKQIQSVAGNNSHAGQVALVVGYANMISPGITRLEQAMQAAQSGALPAALATSIAKLSSDQNALLPPDEVSAYRQAADQIYAGVKQRADQLYKYYAPQDPTHTIQPYPGFEDQPQGGGGYRVVGVR